VFPQSRRFPAIALLASLSLFAACSDDSTTEPTPPAPPAVLGQDVSAIDHQGATLGGWVDGHGRPTVCWFAFGGGATADARTPTLDAGAVAGPVRVEHDLFGLTPETVYAWQLVAVAGGDTVAAADTTFATLRVPNEPPMTHATHAPPQGNVVHFLWTGSDPDGVVTGFRWRLSDNGLDGAVDVADTLGLPWHATTATDSVFTVSADQPGDLPDPDVGGPTLFAQVHTFWIKAVDNRGAADPTPAFITFTAVSEAPEVTVSVLPAGGAMPDGCFGVSLPARFAWTASDPDGPPDAVLQVRTLLLDLADLGLTECLTRDEYEVLDPLAAVDEAQWSAWQEHDPTGPDQPTLALESGHIGGRYLFAAMARDGAGAWTRVMAWGRNVWQVEVLPD
jgi:hypothetical protein